MEQTVLTWNVTNMVTVVLMAAIGFAVLRVIFTVAGNKSGATA